MKFKTAFAAMAAICLLSSCEDLFEEGNLQPDGSKPSLTINNPTVNQNITTSQGLKVYVTVVDKDEVENINFSVSGVQGEKALLDFTVAPHKTVVEFDTLVALDNITPGSYTLKISAKDKRTNLIEKEVAFNVK
ncbi:Ig-like domain-containing protein [Pontibacter sp. E15-1]|uniref:Ig-like domain-containing protein n=1 Tax=Pontibacter sp. E15-1 TaxID=2919918 RepID=UPI001F502228|nr:Ig-like domain-containing protein [Pontibacter sp. E15-1]MCJ8167500.1 Ig-like domain-containing protein [Pontibacter sp. E15-1]